MATTFIEWLEQNNVCLVESKVTVLNNGQRNGKVITKLELKSMHEKATLGIERANAHTYDIPAKYAGSLQDSIDIIFQFIAEKVNASTERLWLVDIDTGEDCTQLWLPGEVEHCNPETVYFDNPNLDEFLELEPVLLEQCARLSPHMARRLKRAFYVRWRSKQVISKGLRAYIKGDTDRVHRSHILGSGGICTILNDHLESLGYKRLDTSTIYKIEAQDYPLTGKRLPDHEQLMFIDTIKASLTKRD